MKLDLESNDVRIIRNLVTSRINELREKLADVDDKEDELKEVIRTYKRVIKKIDEQINID
ncbi:hypothetical protein D4Z93_08585 [Clostridium fermenticellae]|uniref:Uncharacterized protein n=1 Tax=Clostridium fermenticellae TaxID=2068654 RepID=A0A386H4B2_9CLOT|nr:hypothetical protein [Clostridium fermenticellae]AYD40581.1 hypothetical protein D4Z93_08585 [Clostridium fermenticellae]